MSAPVVRAGGWLDADVPPPDPRIGDAQSRFVQGLVYGRLGFLDDSLRLTPTATVAGWSDDTIGAVSLRLRDGATFGDRSPLRAADVVAAWRDWAEHESRWPVPQVECVDEATLLLRLPDVAPLVGLADVSALLLGRRGPRGWVGAGEMCVSEVNTEGMVLAPRTGGETRGLHLVRRQDVAADVAKVVAGELDYLELDGCAVPPESARSLTLRRRVPGSRLVCVAFNLERHVLRDRAVRAALAHAIDRQGVVMRAARGGASVADAMLGPDSPWAHDHLVEREYDVSRAELLLTRAGWVRDPHTDLRRDRAGRALSLRLVVPTLEPVLAAAARAIAEDLAVVAVETSVYEVDPGRMAHVMASGDFDAAVLTFSVRADGTDLFRLYHSVVRPDVHGNPWRYSNPDVDYLLDAAFAWDRSAGERKTLLWHVQDIANDDVLHVPLFRRQRAVFTADQPVPHDAHGEYTALYRLIRGSAGTARWDR